MITFVSVLLKKIIDVSASLFPISRRITAQRLIYPEYSAKGAEVYQQPRNMAELPIVVQQAFAELRQQVVALPARYMVRFEQVNVSSHGVIFKNLAIHIPSLVYHTLINEYKGRLLFKQWIGKTVRGDEYDSLALVYDHWGAINYFHWIIESLPRLLVLHKEQPDCALVLPDKLPQFIKDSVVLFGFKNYVSLEAGQVIEAKKLWFVERMGNFWLQDTTVLQEVQAKVKEYYGLCQVKPYRCVYVSRSRAKYRRLSNEDDVIRLVETAGFEVFFFEDLSFEQQVKLMHETRVLAGLHGASLTNLLFMQRETYVIELLNEKAINLTFFKLASQCAVNYCCLPCTSQEDDATNNSDMLVSIEKLGMLLKQVTG
jgi:hypothetical protein